MTAIMCGTIMVVLDLTIVNVALHAIGEDLGAGGNVEWTVTAYLLGVVASQPACGWAAERFGRKEVYLASLAAFSAASLLCALSQSMPQLAVARVIQGFGGGALIPIGMAICLDLFPRNQHGRAIATWGMAAMLGPALGPTFGGWLVTAVSWQWVFFINVPIGAVCIVLGLRVLPATTSRRRAGLDVVGLVVGIAGLSTAVLALSQASQWGWSSPATVACAGAGAGALVAFVRHELRTPQPLIELRMLEHHAFRLTLAIVFLVNVAQFGRMVFVALELTDLRGYTPFEVGMIFMPSAALTGLSMQVGGRLCDRVGPRLPILCGLVTALVATAALGMLTIGTPVPVIVAILSLHGLGHGLTNAPVMVAGLSQMPKKLLSQGAAMRMLTNQVAGVVAVAVLGAVVSARLGDHPSPGAVQAAYNSAFLVAAVGLAFAVSFAYRLPRGVPDLDEETLEIGDEAEAVALL
jgi:EmrB/QacA subfamily drug resistance transporter